MFLIRAGGRAAFFFFFAMGLAALSPAFGQAAHPFGAPEAGAGTGPGWLGGIFGQVAAWQSHFYLQLTGAVRAWQADAGAAWGLLGLSFAYGVFHALGPGHGKAVIASYVLANRQTARNGALLALLSALLQAAVAIGLVVVLAILLNATAPAMNQATRWLETGSYVLVTLLGAWLVWVKILRPMLGRGRVSAPLHVHGEPHADHHEPDCGCGHAHVPAPGQVAGRLDWRKAGSTVLAMGLRPCSGALVVLVFALSQGFFAAGIAAALAMGLGTGLTVAALAVTAVAAGGLATRLGGCLSVTWATRVRGALEGTAAMAILLLGLVLLGGRLVS